MVMVRRLRTTDIPTYPLNKRTFLPVFSITMNCNVKTLSVVDRKRAP